LTSKEELLFSYRGLTGKPTLFFVQFLKDFNMQLSAGLLLYKKESEKLMFFLVHPGGPFFAKKDDGYWTIPKGLVGEHEEPLHAAIREFEEETGVRPEGIMKPLQPITQKGGKKVMCWAVACDISVEELRSNTFELNWPPKSDKVKVFPEVDKYGWFEIAAAKKKINERQVLFLEEVKEWMLR
jgi:predicted NUDIX family NTP pyrophosphohydrolase